MYFLQPTFGGIVKTPPAKSKPYTLLQLIRRSLSMSTNSDVPVVNSAGDACEAFGESTAVLLL